MHVISGQALKVRSNRWRSYFFFLTFLLLLLTPWKSMEFGTLVQSEQDSLIQSL